MPETLPKTMIPSLLACLLPALIIAGCASDEMVTNIHEQTPAGIAVSGDSSVPSAVPPSADGPKKEIPAGSVETEHVADVKLTDLEIQKYAYELGLDPKKELTPAQKSQIADRKRLRELERSLDSEKERLQYSKVLPWLNGDTEKIAILSIPSIEGRQVWINKNKIWARAKNLKNFDEVVEAQDIAIGMPAEYVKKSWGEPNNIETSGNPIYRNERWEYLKQVSTPQGYKQETRTVYFEGGRVTGWETE